MYKIYPTILTDQNCWNVYNRILQPSRYLPGGAWDELNSNSRYKGLLGTPWHPV